MILRADRLLMLLQITWVLHEVDTHTVVFI